MKNLFKLSALLWLAAATISCTQNLVDDDLATTTDSAVINFSTVNSKATKAANEQERDYRLLGKYEYGTAADKANGYQYYLDLQIGYNDKVKVNNLDPADNTHTFYWPLGQYLVFRGYSPAVNTNGTCTVTHTTTDSEGNSSSEQVTYQYGANITEGATGTTEYQNINIQYVVPTDASEDFTILTPTVVANQYTDDGKVTVSFRHMLSKVNVILELGDDLSTFSIADGYNVELDLIENIGEINYSGIDASDKYPTFTLIPNEGNTNTEVDGNKYIPKPYTPGSVLYGDSGRKKYNSSTRSADNTTTFYIMPQKAMIDGNANGNHVVDSCFVHITGLALKDSSGVVYDDLDDIELHYWFKTHMKGAQVATVSGTNYDSSSSSSSITGTNTIICAEAGADGNAYTNALSDIAAVGSTNHSLFLYSDIPDNEFKTNGVYNITFKLTPSALGVEAVQMEFVSGTVDFIDPTGGDGIEIEM